MRASVVSDAIHRILKWIISSGILPMLLVALFLSFGAVQSRVLSFRNLFNILTQASYLSIFATAQMIVLVTRGFDLSLGATVSMVSVLTGLGMMGWLKGHPDAVAMAILIGCFGGLGVGLGVGVVNGCCISFLRVNPFVVTLGTLNIALGVASTISGGFPIHNLPNSFSHIFVESYWIGLPAPVAIAAIFIIITYFILKHTVLGRSLYLIGANPRAAYVAGLPVRFYITCAYMLCSLFATFGALMLTARTGSGEPNLGGGLMLLSIGAPVIGGVSLRGGAGSIISPALGALFITVLSNGMNLLRVDGYIQEIVLGGTIVGAIFLDRLRRRQEV